MVAHYDPYPSEYEQSPFCGTPDTENTVTSNNWNYVSCKRCLKAKAKADKFVKETENIILNQMQGFVDLNNKRSF